MDQWAIRVEDFPGNQAIFDDFERLFVAAGAPQDMALFDRSTDDFTKHVYVLTPAAAAAFPFVGCVQWGPANLHHIASEKGWSLAVGHASAREDFKVP
jgi:hypothetical protein